MSVARMTRRCPFCKEAINAEASRCKHCQAEIPKKSTRLSFLTHLNTFRTGFLTGILFSLILGLLGYFHYFSD